MMQNPYFDLVRTVWHYGRPWRLTIIGYYIAYIIAQTAMGFSPYAFGRTIDILQHFSPGRLTEVILWLGMAVALLFIFWLFHGPARVIERKVALKIQQALRIELYEQLTHLPLKWHQDHHSGNVISRINRASVALNRFAGDQFIYIETIVQFLVSIAFMFWISLPIGLLNLAICILAVNVVVAFDRRLIPLYDAENEIDNRVGAVLFDYISNMTTILTLRLGELTRSNLWHRLLTVWPFFNKDVVINEVKWFTMGMLLTTLQSGLLIGYIIYHLHTSGAVLIGTVVMLFRYQTELNNVFYNLSAHYSDLVHMNTDIKGLQPLLEDIEKWAHLPVGAALARQWHVFSVQELTFHHRGSKKHNQINQITFEVKRGEKIALIGPSGAGKSTLLNLLSGLYTPDMVHLKIDEGSFDSLEPLKEITTLIPQEPEIFENSLAFNITMDLEAGPEAINRILKLSGFAKVLETLPEGLNTDIKEKGLNFSVGQKQRLALARGLFAARFSSLILMDEPTSSLDLITEQEILSGILEAFLDAAMMVSLHRLHLLPKFDRIIMLSHGNIIADGNAKDLLNNPGPVLDLWRTYTQDTSKRSTASGIA